VFLTRPPLPPLPKKERTFDLHVLGTPPAFILSQDQTRHPCFYRATCMRCAPQVESSFVRCVSRDPGQAVAVLDTLHLAVRRFALASPNRRIQASLFDRNCCGRLRVSPVAVLLSTLQLSRFMIERLFRSSQSTQALLHISGIVSSIYLSNITTFTKTPLACYLRQNDILWVISDQSTQ
jgi:hypothetical protein